jgi:hypothetical protein
MSKAKRARYLQKQERRRQRSTAPPGPPAKMRFKCSTCGAGIEQDMNITIGPVQLVNEDTGEVHQLDLAGSQWAMQCPVCGGEAKAINQHTVSVGGISVTGFADTPEHVQALVDAIDELRGLDAQASLDEIASVLEQQSATQPVAEYLRKNHLALAGLGVGLLAAVIALLTWLMPVQDDPPSPPSGVTEEQMERLLADFEAELREMREEHQHDGDRGQEHSHERQPEGSGADRGDADGGRNNEK